MGSFWGPWSLQCIRQGVIDMNNCECIFVVVNPIDLQCNSFHTNLVLHKVESIHWSAKIQACGCHRFQTKKFGSNLQIGTAKCPRIAEQLLCGSQEASTRKHWMQQKQQKEGNLHHSRKQSVRESLFRILHVNEIFKYFQIF